MSNFLNTLIQRERGNATHAIEPRVQSRYEPIERKTSFTAFDETEHSAANWEADSAETHPHTDTTPSANSVLDRGSIPAEPGPETNDAKPARGEPVFTAENRAETAPQTSGSDNTGNVPQHHQHTRSGIRGATAVTAPLVKPIVEEFDENAQHPVTAANITSTEAAAAPESAAESGQSARRKDLPSPNSHEEADIVETHTTKSRGVTPSRIDGIGSTRGTPSHHGHERYSPPPLVTSPVVATATTAPAEEPAVKHAQPASRDDTSVQPVNAAVDAVESVSVSPSREVNRHMTVSRIGNNTRHEKHANGIPPVSHEAVPARAMAGKISAIVPAPPSSILPDTLSRREARMPPPAPTINVSIGRIEVRAVTPPATPRRPHAEPKAMSLDQYLSQHPGQRGQRGSR